ncbi:RNA polymerase sigma factor [Paracoccus versutus]|uniref:RNA polymerase sigma factor n=1 Tax=Paracoccus versutus TaxID=34007 RepID=UPI000DF74CB2|nr:RNA polymerase sigma factor [Paracoccus versutus]RDD69892.1 RNA polymerase sigma factor [Paracoccus versutus]
MAARDDEFAELYAAEHDRLERQIARRVGCRSTARDLVHDVFLRLWERATDWRGESAAYLTRCARNAAIDHIRAEKRHSGILAGFLPEQQVAETPSAMEQLGSRQQLGKVEVAIAALPPMTQDIFLLNRVHGKSFSEIAHAMDISRRTVASHMARALAACEKARGERE